MKGPFDGNESAADIMRNRRGPITVDIYRLSPLEIVFLKRFAICGESTPEAFDRLANDFEDQLTRLPEENLPFAREVFTAFADSTDAIDRYNTIGYLRPLALADHDTGFRLRHQLVRDVHPEVRKIALEPIGQLLAKEDVTEVLHAHDFNPPRTRLESLALEGLTLDEGIQLRNAYLEAEQGRNIHVLGQSAVTATIQAALYEYGVLGHPNLGDVIRPTE